MKKARNGLWPSERGSSRATLQVVEMQEAVARVEKFLNGPNATSGAYTHIASGGPTIEREAPHSTWRKCGGSAGRVLIPRK